MAHVVFKKFEELTNEELYETLSLRTEIFVLEQTCLYQDLDGRDQVCIHAVMYEGEKIVGYLRILPPGQTFDTTAIGRVIVPMEERRQGYARQLMVDTLKYIKDNLNVSLVKMSAQQYLTAFYESLGFRITSEPYLEDDIPHIEMEIDL